jgi:hypothetical protein
MAFPESALFTTKHLAFDRAGERSIDIRHARLAASQGIEHQPHPESIAHDVALPEEPHTTLRVITTTDKKVAKTAYYLDTATAVQHREQARAKAQHAQGVAKAERQQEAVSQAKTASSKASQKEKQDLRAHSSHREEKPSKKCVHCASEGWTK